MSDWSTADMVAWLRDGDDHVDAELAIADRLAELDAKNADLQLNWTGANDELAKIHDVLPPCPTCGGTRTIEIEDGYAGSQDTCPDCPEHPGKASVEQLVATYNEIERLWAEGNRDATVYHLRSVKP